MIVHQQQDEACSYVCVSHSLLQFALCLIWLDSVIALELVCAITCIPLRVDILSIVATLSEPGLDMPALLV